MTLPNTLRRAGPFNGNGVTTVFPFTFKVFDESDLVVTKVVTATGVSTTLALTTDYTVSLNADQDVSPGGSITYNTLATGERLSITGGLPYDQTLDLPGGGQFSPSALEDALDRIVMLVQQVQEMTGRTLVLPSTSADASAELPSPVASYLLGWDSGGTYLQNYSYESLGVDIAYGASQTQTFNGTGAQTAFVLTSNAGNASNCRVSVGGVVQVAGIDYTYAEGTQTVTFISGAPPTGTNNVAIQYGYPLDPVTADGLTLGKGGGAVSDNTAYGYQALLGNTTGNANVAIGYNAMSTSARGIANICIGTEAGKNLDSGGNYNVAIGYQSLKTGGNTCADNVAVGYQTLSLLQVNGVRNTAIGSGTLKNSTTGTNNTGVGWQVMQAAVTGTHNIGLGTWSLYALLGGSSNLALGTFSGYGLTSGNNNVALGENSLRALITGSGNVAIGNYAGGYETGSNNFYVDNQNRTNTAGDKANALLYGNFAAAAADQLLYVNAYLRPLSFGSSIITHSGGGTYVVLKTDSTIIQTTTGANYTLPAAATWPGRELHFVNHIAGAATSDAANVVPIGGGAAGTTILAATAGKWATLKSNGTNWLIIASN